MSFLSKTMNMKLSTTLLLLLVGIGLHAQAEIRFLEVLDNNMDTEEVAPLLADVVTLSIDDDVQEVGRERAVGLISTFLDAHKINRKKILHNGKSSEKDSSYKVARITTSDGTYRVFAYSEKKGNSSKIKEIRIDVM